MASAPTKKRVLTAWVRLVLLRCCNSQAKEHLKSICVLKKITLYRRRIKWLSGRVRSHKHFMNNPFCLSLSDHSFHHSTLFLSLCPTNSLCLALNFQDMKRLLMLMRIHNFFFFKNHSDYSVFQVFPVSTTVS